MVPAMRSRIILVAAIFILRLTLIGQAQAPLFGTWKLNLAKSAYDPGPPPYKRSTCRIEPWEDGMKVTYDMVGTRGGITHLEWIGRLDGKDYPIEGLDDVLTNAYTRIDDRTFEVILKVDGVKAAVARIAISTDGKTLTTTTTARNAQGRSVITTTVYEKQ